MSTLNLDEVREYVNEHIVDFHQKRLSRLAELDLDDLIKKNPYLFRAKNITRADELIESTLSAFLSSSEEKMFGDFLEDLAIFVAQRTFGGHKSAATGIDLEFTFDECHYLVSIKSGPNWGNSSQHSKLGQDLQKALNTYRQGRRTQAEAILGICYGKARTIRHSKYGYLKLVGQNFWTFISTDRELYKEIIEPVGFRAREHNEQYEQEVDALANRLIKRFVELFCDERGVIDWHKLVEANSGNYDLDRHGFTF